jgi:hypothetical protein
MINWNDLKNLDVTALDLTKIDLSRLDVRNIDLPRFDLPKMPEIDLPVDVKRVADLARDAAYAGVGAVVISAQKVEERRREMADQVSAQVRKLVDAVA